MEKNKSGERKEINKESKKNADYTAEVIQNREAQKSSQVRKVASQVRSAAQKAEERRRKIESGSIERLRVAESRQEKKAERRKQK